MSLSLVLSVLWIVTASVMALLPSRDNHWRRARVLIVTGLPLVVFVFWQNGPWWGLAVSAAGASILRYPLLRLWRWLRARLR